MAFLLSCEKAVIVDCEDCSLSEPVNAVLTINLSPDAETIGTTEPVEIKIYEGELEDNIIFKTLTKFSDEFTTEVRINKKYTITALYKRDNADYLAIDSVFPRIKYDKDQCESPCFYVYDKTVNLRLKYY